MHRIALIRLCLLLTASLLLFYYGWQQQQRQTQALQHTQQQVAQQRHALQQLQTEIQQRQHYQAPFQQLPNDDNPRLVWLEQLRELQQRYPVEFKLGTQQALKLDAAGLQLHFHPLSFQLDLPHEQNWLALLHELQQNRWFRLNQCQLQRQHQDATPLSIRCEGGWLHLNMTKTAP